MIAALCGLAVAAAAGFAILDLPGRRRSALMALALALAPAIIVGDQWHAPQVVELRENTGLLLAAILGGAAVVAAMAALFVRFAWLFPIALLVALPFRVPLDIGGEDANLLLPLYAVTAAAALAYLYRDRGGPGDGFPSPARFRGRGLGAWLKPALAVSVLLYALALLYSEDRATGVQNLCFFLVPFAVIFCLLEEIEWDARARRTVLFVILVEALVCAAVGFIEFGARDLLWNEPVLRSNEFHVYFRVNSLFWDPNIFGRYLALVIVVAVAALLWERDRRNAWILAAVVLVLWLALGTTFSQSSFAAVIVGMAVLAALRWNAKAVGAVAALAILVGGVYVAANADLSTSGKVAKDTGGRSNLIRGGAELFVDRPLTGYGSGSFSVAYRDQKAGPEAPVIESHTEPVTVAAEQGIVGLLVYGALLAVSLAALMRGMTAVMPGLAGLRGTAVPDRGPPSGGADPGLAGARAGLLAAYVALLVHTLTYASYLEDPVTWVILAIGYSLAGWKTAACRATSAA